MEGQQNVTRRGYLSAAGVFLIPVGTEFGRRVGVSVEDSVLDEPGSYYLKNDVENVFIRAADVSLDGKGHTVGDIVWARNSPRFRMRNVRFAGPKFRGLLHQRL